MIKKILTSKNIEAVLILVKLDDGNIHQLICTPEEHRKILKYIYRESGKELLLDDKPLTSIDFNYPNNQKLYNK